MTRGISSVLVAVTVATFVTVASAAATADPVPEAVPLPTFDPAGVFAPMLRARPPDTTRAAAAVRYPDINLDGLPDLLTVHGTTTNLTAHIGTGGAGAFASGTVVGTRPTTRTWIGQGDLDGDGFGDVASIDSSGSLSFARHTGAFGGRNTFGPDTPFTTGWGVAQLPTFVDLFGRDDTQRWVLDGLADLIFRFSGDNAMYLYRNQGMVNGAPTFANLGALFTNTQAVTGLALADLTGDDFPDFYMTFTDGSARMFDLFAEMDSDGNYYGKWYVLQSSGVGAAERRLLLDATADGWPDLVIRLANGDLVLRRHSRDWDPAHPSRLHDIANQTTLATGWGQYRLVA